MMLSFQSTSPNRILQNFIRYPKSKIVRSSPLKFPNRSATTVPMADLSSDAPSRGSITHVIFDMDGLLLGKFAFHIPSLSPSSLLCCHLLSYQFSNFRIYPPDLLLFLSLLLLHIVHCCL